MPSLLDKLKHKLDSQGGFLKSVSILVGGTAFAQAIGLLVLPLITRLYGPDNFALFAVYASILNVLAVAICLRLEIAIPLPKKDEDGLSLVILALLSNLFFTTLIVLSLVFFKEAILETIRQPQLAPYVWLIPIGVFFTGLYNSLQYWTTRKKQFATIAKTRMTQSIASSTVQIGGGYFGLGAFGLILGQIVNSSAGIVKLFISFRRETKEIIGKVSFISLKRNFKNYDKFPKYSTFESLANVSAIQLPVIIIAAVAIGPEAGYLLLAMKVMGIPSGLIGGAIAQVYLAHAPEHYSEGNLRKYTVQTIKQVAKIAVVPLILIGMVAPIIFPIVFGDSWERAGYMVLWMIPWFVMQILSSPVSMSLHITGNQKIALVLQITGLILRVGFLMLVSIYYSNWVFEYYAISGFVFYTLYLIVILSILRHKSKI